MAYNKIESYDEKITSGLVDNYKKALHLLVEDPAR
jgi:GTP cyclohydrolase I